MSQHDMNIANGPGLTFRTDMNGALTALASQSSGAPEPSPMFPSQMWADTGTGRLKQRNSANTAWLDKGGLDAVLRDTVSAGSFAIDSGTANAYVCSFTPAITVRSESLPIRFKAATTNNGACTLNDGNGAVALVGGAHSALQGGEIVATGDAWALWNPSVGGGSYVLLFCTGGAEQVAPAIQPLQAVNAGQIQIQSLTAFTSAGTAPAFILTPAPAITAYAANQRFRIKFHAASAGAGTINISSLGVKNLKQYDSTGNKVAVTVAAGQLADAEYDGTDFVILDPLPSGGVPTGIAGGFSGLAISTTGVSAPVTVAAAQVTVATAAGNLLTLSTVSLAVSLAASGANGLDTGVSAASTWYALFVIYNPTTLTTAGLLSLSATAPTLPSGFTFKARVGWIRSDATANKFPLAFTQFGRAVRYEVVLSSNSLSFPAVASGAASTPVSVSLSGVVPSTAGLAYLTAGTTGAYIAFAPQGSFTSTPGTAYLSSSQLNAYPFTGGYNASYPVCTASGTISLKSMSVLYCATSAISVLQCIGWEDNL